MIENPQKENGYTPIANEILDALMRISLSPSEAQCLWFILRKTYGWRKKEDWISLSQFVEGTGISKPHVCRALRLLSDRHIITKGGNENRSLPKGAMKIGLNKRHSQWRPLPKGANTHHKSLPKGATTVAKGGNRPLPPGAPTKDNTTKDTIQKKGGRADALTPAQEARDFFENEETQSKTIMFLVKKGMHEEDAAGEIKKFIRYWTERNATGTKQRWQMQKAFEVRRRLTTWMNKAFNSLPRPAYGTR